ncbi:MAG: putative zinc-binding metallopeptidase [Gammaproteobacteria bacterium]
MRRYTCVCGQRLAFDNVQCLACSRRLAFAPERLAMLALEADAAHWRIAGDSAAAPRRLCRNYAEAAVCNWLCPPDATSAYCTSCALSHEIPDLGVDGNLARWARIEAAKRRLVYDLLALGLPFDAAVAADGSALPALSFAFLADTPAQHVVTGHVDGRITLSIAEADDAKRAEIRDALGEPYRTLLGHLRHESGHYYFARLVAHAPALARFRTLFGDETGDYAAALDRHYREGAPADWPEAYVSAYASAHPHEDWAETWAHYLHIRDTLDTARAHGMSVADCVIAPDAAHPQRAFEDLIAAWLPVTLAVNELNRSMGLPDMYPFVLPPAALAKLEFVHDLVRANATARENS